MPLPKRFTLSTLLLVMLLVSLVFGYAQWRSQRLKANVQALKDNGVVSFELTDNAFWPTVEWPDKFFLMIRSYGTNRFMCKGKLVEPDEAIKFYSDSAQQLRAIGIRQVTYRWKNTLMPGSFYINNIESLEELRQPFVYKRGGGHL